MSDDKVDYRLMERLGTQKKLSELEGPLADLIGSEHLYSFLRVVEILRCIGDEISIDITPEEVTFTSSRVEAMHDLGSVLKEMRITTTSSFAFCEDTENPENYKQMFQQGVDDAFDAIKALIYVRDEKDEQQ